MVPQEALIGIIYAVSAAASILVLSRSAEGGEELKTLLVGHLLFVDWTEVGTVFLLYSAVGSVFWLFRKPLLLISIDPDLAFSKGLRVRLWDFLFYSAFGLVVTSSTELAGVLLVSTKVFRASLICLSSSADGRGMATCGGTGAGGPMTTGPRPRPGAWPRAICPDKAISIAHNIK